MFSFKLPMSLQKVDFFMNGRQLGYLGLLLLLTAGRAASAADAPMKEFKTQVEFEGSTGGERDISLEDLENRESLLTAEASDDEDDQFIPQEKKRNNKKVKKNSKHSSKVARQTRQVADRRSFEQKLLQQSTSFESTKDQARSKSGLRALRQERPLRDADLITLSL